MTAKRIEEKIKNDVQNKTDEYKNYVKFIFRTFLYVK